MIHYIFKQLSDILFALIGAGLIGASVIFLDGYVQIKKPKIPIDIEQGEEFDK